MHIGATILSFFDAKESFKLLRVNKHAFGQSLKLAHFRDAFKKSKLHLEADSASKFEKLQIEQ